ncbi:hypothetical protein L1987_36663 [Smallanthus sonchifolius]|uniref:Uncharacterized protein n=1 Tax=Smallanthus sonchifolius TaxID=185202 RepID=A0ACB9HF23_9ASTR|nr:hypothetical protein L1987_36663 [Smallanthus sonchifolius]
MEVGLFRELVLGVVKHTVFEHFVAGADTGEVGRTVKKVWSNIRCLNKGLLSSSYLDIHLMMKELKRRVNACGWLGLTEGESPLKLKTQASSIVEVKM